MSYVNAEPQKMAAAAADLAAIGSSVSAANKNAHAPTAAVQAAGGDVVSAGLAALFGQHAQYYQAVGAHAAEFHDRFVQALREGAGSYANAEAANAEPLQKALGVFSQSSSGHSAGGNGANGVMASGGTGGNPGAGVSNSQAGAGGAGGVSTHGGDSGAGATNSSHGGNGGNGTGGGAVGGTGGVPGGDAHGGAGGGSSGGGGGGSGVVTDPGGSAAGVPRATGAAAGAGGTAAVGVPSGVGGYGGWPSSYGGAGLGGADGAWGASGTGYSGAIGGVGVPAAPAMGLPATSPAVESALPTVAKAQLVHSANPIHPGNPVQPDNQERPGNPADHDRDKSLLLVPVPRLRGLRKLKAGLRNRDESALREQPRDEVSSGPWGREELLHALGLRPPGYG